MPKNEIFAKFAKQLQADGMPLSVGVLYNNMHNQEFFDNLYGILQADGMQMDKQTFAKNLGLGTISSNYKTLGIDGKQNQVPIKTTPTTPKVTPITTQQPKPTAVVPNFNIPSVVKDAETKTQLINSPSPQKAKVEEKDIVSPYYKGIKPDYSQQGVSEQGTVDYRLPTDKELSDLESNDMLKAPASQTLYKGIKNNTFIDPSIEKDYLKALSFSDDDLLADNKTFNAKHDVVYGKTQSDEDYEIAQGKNDIGQKYKAEKQKIDNQYNLINTKINYLNKYIGDKYSSANILDDLDLDNKDLNTKLAKLESIKKSKQPILDDLQSQINLLNENQRLYPISENEYSAQFAFLKAKYDSEAKSINDEIKAIQETQKNFQDKYNDPAISSLLKLRQKAYDVSVQGMSLIDNPIFEKVKKREDEATENQSIVDAKKKLENQRSKNEITNDEYLAGIKDLSKGGSKNIGVNDQAFIVDKTMKLFKDIFTLPRTISGNVENNYGRVDRLADWATRVSERTTQKFPYSSNLQVNSFQKFAEVDGLRVLLDEKGNAYDVRDNNYFSINPIQAEKTIEKYKGNPQEYKKFNQTNVDVLAKNSLSTIADVGVMILGTKGLGAVAGGGRVASTLIGAGVIFTQTHADTYQQGLDAGLNPQQSAQYASLISGGISLISFINPVEYKLAGGGGLFNSIKSNAISNADVALINSGKLSIGEVAKKHTIGIIKNIGGENLEEMVFEPIMQDYVSNMYSKKAEKGFEKQFDPISKQGLETFIITTATAIPFGIAEVNSEMPNYQAEALVTAIENPSTYMQVLQKRKEMGIISEIQMEQQIVQMDEISAIYNSVADDIKENDKAILAGLLAKKNVVTNKIKEIGDNVLSKKWNDTLSKIDEDIQSIVDGVETKNNLVGKGATETNEEVVQEVTQQEKPIKVFSDFDNTLFDPTTQTLTSLGEEMKLRIEAGEDIEIVTARENTKENVDLISGQLGIDPAKITLGLTPEMKAEKVDEFERKSQFIDDNTDNLQAVEGLGNDNVEVVPIVSKEQSFANKLAEKAKANKETKKIEKEQLAKSQEVPLNEKGEVDLPKIATDAIEVKTEVEKGSGGVGGDENAWGSDKGLTENFYTTDVDGYAIKKPITNPSSVTIDGVDFHIAKVDGDWKVIEKKSGLEISTGKISNTKNAAIEDATIRLAQNGGAKNLPKLIDRAIQGFKDRNTKAVEQSLKETTKAIIVEIKSKNLTHVRGKGMGENQALGTFVSTEESNRYETPTQKAEKVDVEIENPLVVDDDYGLVGKRQEILNENRDKFTAEDSNDYQDLPNKKLTLDDLNDDGIKKLAILTTEALKAQGYDSIYFRESDTQEGELVVFDKKKVTFKENNIKLAENNAENEHANSKLTEQDNVEQEPSIKDIEGKAESNNEAELNEVVKKADELISNAVGISRIPLAQLNTDENRFQARDELNQEVVENIAKNFSDADQDPIHVWTDKKDGKTYVLSGHHRYYGAKKAGRKDVKIIDRTNDFTEKEAIKFATEEANANRSMETPLERANTLRKKRENGDSKEEINAFLGKEGKNKSYTDNLSRLNPKGKVIQTLKQLANSADKVTQKEIEKIADWIGEARKSVNGLTDAHENEMFDFLMDKRASERITRKEDFLQKVRSVVNPLLPDQILNLNRFKNKTQGEQSYDEDVLEKKAEISERQKQIDALNDRFSNPTNVAYVSTDNANYAQARKIADDKISKLDSERKALQKQLEDIYRNKGKYVSAPTTGTLFQLSDDNQDPYTEVINGFYSPLEKIINETKFDKLPAKQWIDKFARGEEAKWTGLTEWLSQQTGSVSKADIQQFLKDNRIQVVEVVKGSYSKEVDDLYKKLEAKNKGREFDAWDVKDQDEWMAKRGEPQETKFSQYQLEGEKENYKEVLVTMPVAKSKQEYVVEQDYRTPNTFYAVNQKTGVKLKFGSYELAKSQAERLSKEAQPDFEKQFKSSHFDEPNILVHLRMNTRTDSEGNKVLFLEEVQSDWGQKGKKDGFKINKLPDNIKIKEVGAKWQIIKDGKLQGEYNSESRAKEVAMADFTVPTAPFVTDTNSWTKLGLKVALKEAVKQGADKIAWTTGKQQNDRYDLSKQVDEIQYLKNDNGTYLVHAIKGGERIESKSNLNEKDLEGMLGKDVAKRIVENEGQDIEVSGLGGYIPAKSLRGQQLSVGAKGMKGFYGSPKEGSLGIVGNVAKSLFKQEPKTVDITTRENVSSNDKIYEAYDRNGKLIKRGNSEAYIKSIAEQNNGTYKLVDAEQKSTQHSIDITPEMRAEVQGKGQPLFVLSNAKDQKPFETNDNTKATKEDLTKTFPDAVVVQSESELPQAIQSEIKQQRAEGKVKGVFHNGKVYMVVDNNKTIGEATGTYRHEKLGHKGVISYLKDKLDTYATRIIDSAKGEQLGKLKQLAKRYGFPIDLTKLTPKQKSDLGQEYIAMISENKSKYPKLWNDLVSFVREAIRMFGIKLSVTDTEIQSLIGKVEKIEKTNNDLSKSGKSQFQLSEDTSQKFDPKNKIHVEYSDMLNEYVDIKIEEGVVPTLELLKSLIDEETFDEIVSELGIQFIEGKFNTPFIQNLKLENLSKEQKDNPLVERAQITLGEDARQELDEIGRTYTADKWKEIEPQVDAFVQRVLGSRNFNESVREIIQWMKDMPMSTYLNEDGIATAHTMILNKLAMHAYTLDNELFKEVFKFAKIRATSFGQAIAAYAEASTPESLFNNAIADLEIEKEEILNTVQPNGKTLKQELDLILEQISIKADEITEVLNAIDATTQNVANKTKGKTNKPSGSKPSTSKTKSNFVPRSKEEKAKAKVKIDDAKARLAKWLEKQSTLSFAYDPKADLKAHQELLGISKDFVLGFLQYGYSSVLKIKENLQSALGKNVNVDDFWHEVYDEEVRAKVKDLEKEQIVNAIVNAIKEPGDAKEVNAISQISRILAGVARNKGKSDKTTVPIEEKVRLLFENKDMASKAVEEALRIGIEQIKNNPNLSDAQKLERTTTLQDLASNFTVVPESVSRKAIQAGLKDIKETIESIAKKHYLDAEDAKQSLIDKLVLNAGLSHEDAKEYADILSNELDKQLGEKKAKLADKLLNPTVRKGGNRKGGNKGGNRKGGNKKELTDKEKIVNAIVNAIKDNASTKKQSPINQLARIMGGLVKKLNNSEKTIKPIEEKIRLLFENNLLANEALKESLALGIEEITNNKKLTDEEKGDNIRQLKDIVKAFTIVPESITQKAIKLGLAKTEQTIESVANLTEEQINDIKQKLIDKLVKDANMSKYESQDYAKLIEKEFDKLISDKKANLLDELLNPKPITKTVTKKEIEKIIRAINLGALSSNEFSNLFAEKFGFRALTPQQVQFLQNTISIMFQQNGIMKRRIARTLADYIATLKPLDARNVGMLIQEIFYQHALGGINTVAMNIPIGSTLSVMANMLPVMIKNPMLFVKANLAYNRAGLGGTGIKAFIDTIQTGFNDVDNFVDEKNFLTSGSRYHKFLLSWGFKDPQNFITSVLYKLPMHIGYFASAFDNLINHRGGEILNYMHEYQSTDKSYLTIKEIHKQVEAKMGYDDAKNYSAIVDDEILDMKANGLTIPTGYKEQRVKELMVETRDRDIQQQAYRLIRSYGLMGKPDGISGAIYRAIAPAGIINDKDSNLTAVVKTIASITLLPFLRISFASMGMLASGIPIVGMGLGSYKLEKNEKTKRNEFSFKSAEELKQLAGIQVMTIGALIFGFMEMFDMEDDEKGNTVLSLNKNRSFDITGTNISFFDQDKMQLDKGNYLPLSIRFRKSDGTWGKLHEAGRYMPPIVAVMSILGNLRDKIEIQSLSKLDEEGQIKTTYANKEMVFESLMSIYGGLTVTSYNSLAQFAGKSADIIGYKNKSPQIQSDKKIEDTKKLLFNTIARPVKTLALPNIYRDATKNTEALLGSQKTMDSQYKNILKDFYGLDHLTNHLEVDIFGNKVMQTASFGEDDRYNLPEWKLLRERNITFDTPYFYKTAKFDGEKKNITNEQRLKLNDKTSIAFGNYIRENIEELKGLNQVELIQEFDNYADQAKRDITSLDFNEAIK